MAVLVEQDVLQLDVAVDDSVLEEEARINGSGDSILGGRLQWLLSKLNLVGGSAKKATSRRHRRFNHSEYMISLNLAFFVPLNVSI